MTAQFTPGPWAYRPEEFDDWGVVRAGRYIICQARDPSVSSEDALNEHRRNKTDPYEANARLIAKAPNLYRAAQLIVGACESERPDIVERDDDYIYDELGSAMSAAYLAAREALV